jgi:hypothetical protein
VAQGGGLYATGATLTLDNSTVTFNLAQGGDGGHGGLPSGLGGPGGGGQKGGVFTTGTVLTVSGTTIAHNNNVNGSPGAPSAPAAPDWSGNTSGRAALSGEPRIHVDTVFAHLAPITEDVFGASS